MMINKEDANILIVDDIEDNRYTLERRLKRDGYTLKYLLLLIPYIKWKKDDLTTRHEDIKKQWRKQQWNPTTLRS